MKDLDKNEVYDLRGITHDQAVELSQCMSENTTITVENWIKWIKETGLLTHDGNYWLRGNSNFDRCTTHITTLFETENELEDLIKQRDELNKKIEEYGKPKVGDVCKFWDGSTEESDGYVVSKLTNIHLGEDIRSPYKANINGTWFKNAKKLTEKEVIELLFKK